MLENILLWTICSIFVGILGYLLEISTRKKIWSNVTAGFLGVFLGAGLTHFLIWPTSGGELNIVATIVGLILGFIAVNMEDDLFLVPNPNPPLYGVVKQVKKLKRK